MKTTLDLASIVYGVVKDSDIENIINGGVYLSQRPFNSQKDDVVIGVLDPDNAQLQKALCLVTIYAKDIKSGESHLPNLGLLNEATKHLIPLLDEVYLKDEGVYLHIETTRDYKIESESVNEWAVAIRVQTRNINPRNN